MCVLCAWVYMRMHVSVCVSVYIVNCEYFVLKIFLDSLAYARIKCIIFCAKNMHSTDINNNAVQGHLSENYLTRLTIARNILDMKCSQFMGRLAVY